jgi:hypothetical protein
MLAMENENEDKDDKAEEQNPLEISSICQALELFPDEDP